MRFGAGGRIASVLWGTASMNISKRHIAIFSRSRLFFSKHFMVRSKRQLKNIDSDSNYSINITTRGKRKLYKIIQYRTNSKFLPKLIITSLQMKHAALP